MTLARTSVDGAVMDSREREPDGGPTAADFLNTDTPEDDRAIEYDSVATDDATMDAEDGSDFTIFAPGGATLRGWTGGAVKSGTIAGGNGVFGAGNVCLFTGIIYS